MTSTLRSEVVGVVKKITLQFCIIPPADPSSDVINILVLCPFMCTCYKKSDCSSERVEYTGNSHDLSSSLLQYKWLFPPFDC